MELKQYKDTDVWCDVNGDVYVLKNGSYIKKNPTDKTGSYLSIRVPSLKKTVRVHRIIATSWLDNSLNKPQVNHKDGNKQNNRVDNLEWVTSKENINHAMNSGLNNRYWLSDLNKKNAKKVMFKSVESGLYVVFDSASYASIATGVCERNIRHCCNKKEGRTQAGGYRWEWYNGNN